MNAEVIPPIQTATQSFPDDVCPVCKSSQITGQEVTTGTGQATQEMSCAICGASWVAVYLFNRNDQTVPVDIAAMKEAIRQTLIGAVTHYDTGEGTPADLLVREIVAELETTPL